jgi:hypothetical protein
MLRIHEQMQLEAEPFHHFRHVPCIVRVFLPPTGLAALLDVPLAAAAQNIVPVACTSGESVEKLRQWASGRCLSADHAGRRGAGDVLQARDFGNAKPVGIGVGRLLDRGECSIRETHLKFVADPLTCPRQAPGPSGLTRLTMRAAKGRQCGSLDHASV